MTSACHTRYARSSHSGFFNAAANAAGMELVVGLELAGELEPKVDPEGERELEPPTDELPPAAEAPLERLPPRQEDEDEDDEEEDEGEKPRSGSGPIGPVGTASESTYTSPRMCSTNWAGTPDGLTGCVKITCTPVAVTVSSPGLIVPGPEPVKSNALDEPGEENGVVEVVVVVPLAALVLLHELVVGGAPVSPHELVVDVVSDCGVVVVVPVVVPPMLGTPPGVVAVVVVVPLFVLEPL
jgi:hypothetical protein